MAVSDWSETASANTSIGGTSIAEGCSPGNLNNAIRELMAQIKTWSETLSTEGATYQPLDATLSALAGITTAANKLIYATGSDAFSTTDLTSFGRTMIGLPDAVTARSTLGVSAASAVSGDGTSGKIIIGDLVFAWKDVSVIGANTTTTSAYGAGHEYTSWARAWVNAGASDTGAQENFPYVSSAGLTQASIFSAYNSTASGTLFSIGV